MNFACVRQTLGQPFFETDACLLYNSDCLESLRRLPDGTFDLTVTSPPYNIGKEYETCLSLDEYIDWTRKWTAQVYRTTTDYGAFWWNLGYVEVAGHGKAVPLPYLLWNSHNFYLVQEVVWHYGAGVAARKMLSPRNEKFLWYVKNPDVYTFNLDAIRDPDVKYPNQKKNGKLKCNPNGKNPSDVWIYAKVTSGANRSSKERTPHPAQFPVAIIERIINGTSNKDDIVLDPFIGSGTTAVAALNAGRKVVGFELNPRYCEIAAERIQQSLAEEPQLRFAVDFE